MVINTFYTIFLDVKIKKYVALLYFIRHSNEKQIDNGCITKQFNELTI
jgi:hypothetical protein